MSDINLLLEKVVAFRDEREWKKFHNTKDLAIALNIEVSELLEVFLWKDSDFGSDEKVKEELADIIIYALLIADSRNLDITGIVEDKLRVNNQKYPVSKSKGTSTKYTDL